MEGVFPNELSLQQVRVAALHTSGSPDPLLAALRPPGRPGQRPAELLPETAQGSVLVPTHQARAGEGLDMQPLYQGGTPEPPHINKTLGDLGDDLET